MSFCASYAGELTTADLVKLKHPLNVISLVCGTSASTIYNRSHCYLMMNIAETFCLKIPPVRQLIFTFYWVFLADHTAPCIIDCWHDSTTYIRPYIQGGPKNWTIFES